MTSGKLFSFSPENSNKAVPRCRLEQPFPNHIASINIFREELSDTKPCFCMLHHYKIPRQSVWQYTYYSHDNRTERFLTTKQPPDQINGCGPVYFSIVNNEITLTYSTAGGMPSTLNSIVKDLPLRIVTDGSMDKNYYNI